MTTATFGECMTGERQFVQVDAWLRHVEGDPPPHVRRVLGFELRPAQDPAEGDPDGLEQLRQDLDQVVRQRPRTGKGRQYPGRRRAMMADRELADRAHRLCQEQGVAAVLAGLGVSRQSLQDVWAAHGLRSPGRVAPRRRPRPGGGGC